MLQLSKQQVELFQQKILSWYANNKRNLPWRDMPEDTPLDVRAYRVLISEVMSQQTQISRVIPKYEAWVAELPTIQSLAKAATADILRLWSGLGYNRRALYLQKTAQTLVKSYSFRTTQNTQHTRESDILKVRKSEISDSPSFPSVLEINWPQTEEELRKLPGIGQYTARAILCFAFNQQIAVVDTNVRRVILTQFQISNVKTQISNKELQQIADQLLPYGQAYEWNQALMDYAAAILKHEKITLPKQSKYKNSDRYYRGKIIKILLEQSEISHMQLHDYFINDEQKITKERLEKVIAGLEKDKMVENSKQKLRLA